MARIVPKGSARLLLSPAPYKQFVSFCSMSFCCRRELPANAMSGWRSQWTQAGESQPALTRGSLSYVLNRSRRIASILESEHIFSYLQAAASADKR